MIRVPIFMRCYIYRHEAKSLCGYESRERERARQKVHIREGVLDLCIVLMSCYLNTQLSVLARSLSMLLILPMEISLIWLWSLSGACWDGVMIKFEDSLVTLTCSATIEVWNPQVPLSWRRHLCLQTGGRYEAEILTHVHHMADTRRRLRYATRLLIPDPYFNCES